MKTAVDFMQDNSERLLRDAIAPDWAPWVKDWLESVKTGTPLFYPENAGEVK